MNEQTYLISKDALHTETLISLFEHPGNGAAFRPEEEEEDNSERQYSYSIPVQHEDHGRNKISCWRTVLEKTKKSNIVGTVTGSFVFCIYHIVFCLAQASTITRPHASHNSTGMLAKTAALGTLTAGTWFIFTLGTTIPAIYPATDLFLAPFLAQMAHSIDAVLYEKGTHEDDTIFMGTFLTVSGCGLVLSGILCILAARFKWANMGAFLPYPVLCGFFTTIGIYMWTLGFSVDTGMKVEQFFTCKDWNLIWNALLHHIPSVLVGTIMHIAGRQHPNWVIFCIVATVVGFYVILWTTGTSLMEAQETKWLFSPTELEKPPENVGLPYGPPLPFGTIVSLWRGVVDWDAFWAALPPVLSLAFLYVIRCSLHSSVLKKNIPLLVRKVPKPTESASPSFKQTKSANGLSSPPTRNTTTRLSPGRILEKGYGYSQLMTALIGGITVVPSLSASLTLFNLHAEKSAPQYGSNLLLLVFYLSDFRLVQYIPKTTFSCLMVLAGIDMCRTWMVGSFIKTKDKIEWAVAPLLVLLSFSVGIMNAIFIGIAASTFIFAANFYQAGTVRFVGSGLSLRSTVERAPREAEWLEQHSYLTQILVLQNYLFFGNAQSIVNYVSTMFDDENEPETIGANAMSLLDLSPHPTSFVPKYFIIDFSMVSGMDTSAVDLFHEIVGLCRDHNCKIFFSGTKITLRSLMIHAGIKGSTEYVKYMGDLETALARAEDGLLTHIFHLEERDLVESAQRKRARSNSHIEDGFIYALQKIDEQHGIHITQELQSLSQYTSPVDLNEGEFLIRDVDNGGIYFVETGLMRLTPATGFSSTLSMTSGTSLQQSRIVRQVDPNVSLGHMHARLRNSLVNNSNNNTQE